MTVPSAIDCVNIESDDFEAGYTYTWLNLCTFNLIMSSSGSPSIDTVTDNNK